MPMLILFPVSSDNRDRTAAVPTRLWRMASSHAIFLHAVCVHLCPVSLFVSLGAGCTTKRCTTSIGPWGKGLRRNADLRCDRIPHFSGLHRSGFGDIFFRLDKVWVWDFSVSPLCSSCCCLLSSLSSSQIGNIVNYLPWAGPEKTHKSSPRWPYVALCFSFAPIGVHHCVCHPISRADVAQHAELGFKQPS